jgi:hypothetical protein
MLSNACFCAVVRQRREGLRPSPRFRPGNQNVIHIRKFRRFLQERETLTEILLGSSAEFASLDRLVSHEQLSSLIVESCFNPLIFCFEINAGRDHAADVAKRLPGPDAWQQPEEQRMRLLLPRPQQGVCAFAVGGTRESRGPGRALSR